MQEQPRERRRFRALLGRLKETLVAPYVVTYLLVDKETLIELEEGKARGLIRLYFDGTEMNTKEFSLSAIEESLRSHPPRATVRIARHAMGSRGGVAWFVDRVIDPKIDLSVAWADLRPRAAATVNKPSWVDTDITENPDFTPMGIVLQACEALRIPRP